MAQLFRFLYFVVFFYCAVGKIAILPDEGIENCAKPEESADYFDLDQFEVVVESDYDVFLNGTFRFKKEIKSWHAHFFTEEFYRNEWTKRLVDRKVADFCKHIHSPTELWYNQLRKQPGCPIKAGDEWKFEMEPLTNFPVVIPPNFAGKWRMNLISEFEIGGKTKIECRRIKFDMIDR